MTAESEVSISFAISIFSNEKFKADDNRLNYDSYEELGLICGQCRELVFFKQGTKRISHFSHFRDTGKDCLWRTESQSNTQSSDSYKREQSLQEFQTKFRGIIKQGIIKYRQISSTQLDTQIAEGKSLVSTYKIDIDSWLRWFNQNRKQLGNLAKNLYQSNELVSERNQRILLNFLDYLCVPASEYILKDILYYVFGLLDKEISLKKYLEEVPSKVIELMSYVDWEKEYQVAQESLTFNEFPGYTHPNLPVKPPKSATITERIEPKPIQLDGARTNDHEYQLRAIVGNVPMILTFVSSGHLWDVIALPVKVPPYHLAVYLSDKVGSTELLSYIGKHKQELCDSLAKTEVKIDEVKEQITNLSDDPYFLPRGRSLQAKIDSLFKVKDNITSILNSLESLALSIKQNRKPDRLDVLGSTKIIQGILQDNHIKPESSYTDDYYRWHNIGSLRIIEQIERENHSYHLTILGSEKDTRRSKIPMVMNWMRTIPAILQKHFRETYPTNDEIKAHLMSVYPFYKRRLREGDKLDKSYVNLEADMVIKTKGRLIIEIYFDNACQTSQLISITKPVDGKDRQGKIPVKIASTFEVNNLDGLIHLLRCNDRKQLVPVQDHINRLVQKFVNDNTQLFTREREDKIVSKVATKDLLGFSKSSKGFPQIVKEYNRFVTPFTSESEIDIGKFVNLLTLETFDKHDAQNLLDAMVTNWKKWKNTDNTNFLLGFNLSTDNPGNLIKRVVLIIKSNQNRRDILWGNFIDELYKLSQIPIGFRTSEGVILTPWSLLPTDKKTWEHRIRIQLIDILSVGQREKIKEVEYLIKNAKTQEEGKRLRDSIRGGSVDAWLQMDIDKLYSQLHKVRPNWESLVHKNVLFHLSALHDALNVVSNVK